MAEWRILARTVGVIYVIWDALTLLQFGNFIARFSSLPGWVPGFSDRDFLDLSLRSDQYLLIFVAAVTCLTPLVSSVVLLKATQMDMDPSRGLRRSFECMVMNFTCVVICVGWLIYIYRYVVGYDIGLRIYLPYSFINTLWFTLVQLIIRLGLMTIVLIFVGKIRKGNRSSPTANAECQEHPSTLQGNME